MGKTMQNLVGVRFGRLKVKAYAGQNKHKQHLWLCICDCGQEKPALGFVLRRGESTSCGCYRFEAKRKPLGVAALNTLIRNYKRNAKQRKFLWVLTIEEFKQLALSNCHYCGCKPRQSQKATSITGGSFVYNGIDRQNNCIGYELNNCVSCCGECNKMKMDLSYEDFLAKIELISSRFISLDGAFLKKEEIPIIRDSQEGMEAFKFPTKEYP